MYLLNATIQLEYFQWHILIFFPENQYLLNIQANKLEKVKIINYSYDTYFPEEFISHIDV